MLGTRLCTLILWGVGQWCVRIPQDDLYRARDILHLAAREGAISSLAYDVNVSRIVWLRFSNEPTANLTKQSRGYCSDVEGSRQITVPRLFRRAHGAQVHGQRLIGPELAGVGPVFVISNRYDAALPVENAKIERFVVAYGLVVGLRLRVRHDARAGEVAICSGGKGA